MFYLISTNSTGLNFGFVANAQERLQLFNTFLIKIFNLTRLASLFTVTSLLLTIESCSISTISNNPMVDYTLKVFFAILISTKVTLNQSEFNANITELC